MNIYSKEQYLKRMYIKKALYKNKEGMHIDEEEDYKNAKNTHICIYIYKYI